MNLSELVSRIVHGSPGWTRTSDLSVTLILMFPWSVDYIFANAPMSIGGQARWYLVSTVPLNQARFSASVQGSHGIGLACCLALAFTVIPTSFNLVFTRKLRDAVFHFAVTIGAEKDAMIELLFHLLPTPCVSLLGYPEVFFIEKMMEFERLKALFVTAELTLAALIFDRLLSYRLSTFCDSRFQICCAVGVFSKIFHIFGKLVHSRLLYHWATGERNLIVNFSAIGGSTFGG